MKNNIVTIDPSLSCTALVVNDRKFIYTDESISTTRKGKSKKWFEATDHLLTTNSFSYVKSDMYSILEIQKLNHYNKITDSIIADILMNLEPNIPIIIGIEGYSYSSAAGPLIDLVCFGTLLRSKLSKISSDITVYAPTTLKSFAAQLTYTPIKKGKKFEYRNNDGVSGGKFTKHEMYKALTENPDLNCEWLKMLREYKDEIFESKSVPKPIEDMNDAKLMYEIIKNLNK